MLVATMAFHLCRSNESASDAIVLCHDHLCRIQLAKFLHFPQCYYYVLAGVVLLVRVFGICPL